MHMHRIRLLSAEETKERVCHVSGFYPENADKEVSRVATRSAVNTTSSQLFKDIQTKWQLYKAHRRAGCLYRIIRTSEYPQRRFDRC